MAVITNMTLSNIIFIEGKPEASDKNDVLRLEGFKREKIEENKTLHVTLDFQLISPKLSLLSLRYCLDYSYIDDEDLSHLKAAVILAHAIPLVRELVANITMRTQGKIIYLGTINTNDLYQDYLERQKKQAPDTQPPTSL